MESLRLVERGKGYAILASPRMFITMHDGPPDMASVMAEARYARTSLGHAPRSVGCMVILRSATTPPPEEVRAAIPALLDDIAKASAGLAMVIEGTGFRGAALRAVFSGFLLIKRMPYPTSVFGGVTEALGWLCPQVGLDAASMEKQLVALLGTPAA